MYKIFLAVGNKDLENYLKNYSKSLIEKYRKVPVKFIGETVYRGGILTGVNDYKPDVIVLREGLMGSENITEIIYELKVKFPETRIIFISGDREIGDALLSTLVQYGIYDLIIGNKVNANDIVKLLIQPNKFSSVAHLMPKIAVDEKTNTKLFEAPTMVNVQPSQNIEPIIEPITSLSEREKILEDKPLQETITDSVIEEEPEDIENIDTLKISDEDTVIEKIVIEDTEDINKMENSYEEEIVIEDDTESVKVETVENENDDFIEIIEEDVVDGENSIIIENNEEPEVEEDEITIEENETIEIIDENSENLISSCNNEPLNSNINDYKEDEIIIDDEAINNEDIIVDDYVDNKIVEEEPFKSVKRTYSYVVPNIEVKEEKLDTNIKSPINDELLSFNKFKKKEAINHSSNELPTEKYIETENYEHKNTFSEIDEVSQERYIPKEENYEEPKKKDLRAKLPFGALRKKENSPKNMELNIEREEPLKTTKPVERTSGGGLFNKFFGGRNDVKRVNQQIITFMGGKSGVGNSHIAFNTALKLAQKGFKVIYLDLNNRFSSLDYILQLGYNDVGIDTALQGIKNEDFKLIHRSIANVSKILSDTRETNYLYKTYSKLPTNMDFLFFSTEYMEREIESDKVDYNYLKDLNMYLLMEEGYDYIILDANSNIHDRLTQIALAYSTKIFFTVTQDVSVLGNHLKTIKIMRKKRINFEEKFYYLLNQYENADMSLTDVFEMLGESLKIDSFNIVPIPNLNRDLINANYNGIPLLWQVKSKTVTRAFSDIEKLIL